MAKPTSKASTTASLAAGMNFQEAFDRSQREHPDKMSFTPAEAEKFKKAFEDPEFRTLFAEYMDELQDPAHRDETEAYISQLEGENKVPAGKQLIRPTPAFVVKTRKVDGKSEESDKIFINIVTSDKINAPTKQVTKEGTHWSLPYSVGPPHMQKDKKSATVPCFDCCFHPEAATLGASNRQFRDLLVKTAMDGVQAAFKRQQQDVKLHEDFHVVKGISYKDGVVATMLVDVKDCEEQWTESKSNASTSTNPTPSAAQTTSMTGSSTAKLTPDAPTISSQPSTSTSTAITSAAANPTVELKSGSDKKSETTSFKKGFLSSAPSKSAKPAIETIKAAPATTKASTAKISTIDNSGPTIDEEMRNLKMPGAPPEKAPSRIVELDPNEERSTTKPSLNPPQAEIRTVASKSTSIASVSGSEEEKSGVPKYTYTERGIAGMGDFEAMKANTVASNRPSEIVYKIELPLVTSAAAVNLDVAERELTLVYKDIYALKVALPYPVYDKKGTAKYDKKTKTLLVTLPVQPGMTVRTTKAVPVTEVETSAAGDSSNGLSSSTETEVEGNLPAAKATSGSAASPAKPVATHNRWIAQTASDEQSRLLKEEVQRKAQEAVANAERERITGKAEPKVATAEKSATRKESAGENSDVPGPSVDSFGDTAFIASRQYVGSKEGYVFTTGEKGTGYYPDNNPLVGAKRASPVTESQPVVEEDIVAPIPLTSPYKAFKVECRQTAESVAVLVQVSGIIADSVGIQYGANEITVSFQSLDSSNSAGKVYYGMKFTLEGSIEVAKCKHDVAPRNMVIVLAKAVSGLWKDGKSTMAGNPNLDVIRTATVLDGPLPTPVAVISPVKTSSASDNSVGTPKLEESGRSRPESTTSHLDPRATMQAMQFQATSGLYELD